MEGFFVRVYSSSGQHFRVRVAAATPTVDDLKEAIKGSEEGKYMGFNLLWKVFPADEAGAIAGEALDPEDPFPVPSQGITARVRVEHMGGGESLGEWGHAEGPLPIRSNLSSPPPFLLHPRAGGVAAPQTGKSNPHTRDAGRGRGARRKRPFVFGAPLCSSSPPPPVAHAPLASSSLPFRRRRRTRRRRRRKRCSTDR
jgi:hypothetical protein